MSGDQIEEIRHTIIKYIEWIKITEIDLVLQYIPVTWTDAVYALIKNSGVVVDAVFELNEKRIKKKKIKEEYYELFYRSLTIGYIQKLSKIMEVDLLALPMQPMIEKIVDWFYEKKEIKEHGEKEINDVVEYLESLLKKEGIDTTIPTLVDTEDNYKKYAKQTLQAILEMRGLVPKGMSLPFSLGRSEMISMIIADNMRLKHTIFEMIKQHKTQVEEKGKNVNEEKVIEANKNDEFSLTISI
jgi:hypothetical protein